MAETQLNIVARARDEASGTLDMLRSRMGNLESDQPRYAKAAASAFGEARAATERATGALHGMRGALGGTIDILGKVGLAGMGLQTVASAAKGLGNALGLGLNVEMENVTAQLNAFTKDGAVSAAILADIRKEADKTPFAFQAMAKATAGLMPAAKQAGVGLMDLVRDAEILAASNPAEGLEGAAFSLREAVSGDFTSIIERFNLPRSMINQLKDEGVPALEVVRKAMKAMGYDTDLVSNLSKTASGRWSTLMDTFDGMKAKLSAGIFDRLKDTLAGAQGWLDANKATFDQWATGIGDAIAGAFDTAAAIAGRIGPVLGGLTGVFSGVEGAGLGLHNALERLVGLDVANFLVGIVQGAQNLGAMIGPVLADPMGALRSTFADFAPAGEALGVVFRNIADAIGSFVPEPVGAMLTGLLDTAAAADAGGGAFRLIADAVNGAAEALAAATNFVKEHEGVQAALVGVLTMAVTGYTLSTAAAAAHAVVTKVTAIATGLMTGAQWLLNAALTANPIGLVIVGLAGLAAGVKYAYDHMEPFRNAVDGTFAFIKAFVPAALDLAGKAVQGFTDGTIAAVNGVVGAINGMIRGFNAIRIDIPRLDIDQLGIHVGGFTVEMPRIPELPYIETRVKFAAARGAAQMADGGRVMGAGYSWVGEEGPELLHLPTGATVAPLQAIPPTQPAGGFPVDALATAIVRAISAQPVNLNVDGQRLAAALRGPTARIAQRNVGLGY